MKYEEVRLLKQSEKGTVHLVKEKDGGRVYIRKRLKGTHPVYRMLLNCPHPNLPKLFEVTCKEDSTTIIQEYIEGEAPGGMELSEKQIRSIVRQLCLVLEFLHGKGIIHRDIKPSNLIFTEDGRLYLIDFDAARLVKEEQEQDTRLLGTRGFAPPEQYGFSQTDERADIYAMGATLRLLLGERAQKPHYKRVIQRCMALDPDKRYQSVGEMRRSFFYRGGLLLLSGLGAFVLLTAVGCCILWQAPGQRDGQPGSDSPDVSGEAVYENAEAADLRILPAPGNPHWDGETGIAMWDNVPESGVGDEVQFYYRLYKRDTQTPPDLDDSDWMFEGKVRMGGRAHDREVQYWNLVTVLEGNGFYYFTICAIGDGISYADSPFAVSDAFAYTGESAPPLPAPTGLAWKEYEVDNARQYYAAWSNLEDYEDKDSFNVTLYDKEGNYVMNNIWTKSDILERGYGGIRVGENFLTYGPGQAYRFTVQVYSSRPNEYGASPMPDPTPEEYYSPWLVYGPPGTEEADSPEN